MPDSGRVGRRLGDGGLRGQDQPVGDDAVEERDEQHDDEGELDHLRAALVVLRRRLSPFAMSPRARSQGGPPPLYLGRRSNLS